MQVMTDAPSPLPRSANLFNMMVKYGGVESSSSSSSASSSSESTKARRGRLNKVMSCLNSLEAVLDPECEDCARVLSEAKAHLKACF